MRDGLVGGRCCCMDGLKTLLYIGTVGCFIIDKENGEPTRPIDLWHEKDIRNNDKSFEQVCFFLVTSIVYIFMAVDCNRDYISFYTVR